jgi:hypothetical protein
MRLKQERCRLPAFLVLVSVVLALLSGSIPLTRGEEALEFLNREWNRRTGPPEERTPSRTEPGNGGAKSRSGGGDSGARAAHTMSSTSHHNGGAYCVRTCDGFYFPLSSGGTANAQTLCQSLCPAAKTDVYYRRSDSIDDARNRGGKPYAALPEAFAYRKHLKPDCTCRSASTPALTAANDPTLRSGDIVVTETAVVMFRGGSQPPHKEGDFVDYRSTREVAGNTRAQLDAMVRRYYSHRAQAPASKQKIKPANARSRSTGTKGHQVQKIVQP